MNGLQSGPECPRRHSHRLPVNVSMHVLALGHVFGIRQAPDVLHPEGALVGYPDANASDPDIGKSLPFRFKFCIHPLNPFSIMGPGPDRNEKLVNHENQTMPSV